MRTDLAYNRDDPTASGGPPTTSPHVAFFFAIVLAITSAGWRCIPLCLDTDSRSPRDLVASNDHVCLALVQSTDTLARMGVIDKLGADYESILLEYRLSPVEVFKGCKGVDILRLWYQADRQTRSDWWNAPEMQPGDTTLVYGNTLRSTDNIIKVLKPSAGAHLEELIALMDSKTPKNISWTTRTEDSTKALRLLESSELKYARSSAGVRDPIIYATDAGMLTADEFHHGYIGYCDRRLRTGFLVTSKEYLEKLRDIAQ